MTVASIQREDVRCLWFGRDAKSESSVFPLVALRAKGNKEKAGRLSPVVDWLRCRKVRAAVLTASSHRSRVLPRPDNCHRMSLCSAMDLRCKISSNVRRILRELSGWITGVGRGHGTQSSAA